MKREIANQKRREARAEKKREVRRAERKHAQALSQRSARALQKRDPAAFAKKQRAILDRNKRRRERYAEKKSEKRIEKIRAELLGDYRTGEGPHGTFRDDWMALRAMHRARSREWQEFLEACQAEGWTDHEAADEWYSPEM